MDIIGPALPGCPLEDEERVGLFLELDPDSLLSQYITWLESTAVQYKEEVEKCEYLLSKYRDTTKPSWASASPTTPQSKRCTVLPLGLHIEEEVITSF